MRWLSSFRLNISLAQHKHLNSHGALIFFAADNKTKGNEYEEAPSPRGTLSGEVSWA